MTKYLLMTFTLAFVSASMVAPAFTADRFIGDGARSSNTYQTYQRGQGGCVEDMGYGRVRDGCGGE
jgi:hypothetical protein